MDASAQAKVLSFEGRISVDNLRDRLGTAAAWIGQSEGTYRSGPSKWIIGTHFGANHVVGDSASQNIFKYVTGVNFTFGSE